MKQQSEQWRREKIPLKLKISDLFCIHRKIDWSCNIITLSSHILAVCCLTFIDVGKANWSEGKMKMSQWLYTRHTCIAFSLHYVWITFRFFCLLASRFRFFFLFLFAIYVCHCGPTDCLFDCQFRSFSIRYFPRNLWAWAHCADAIDLFDLFHYLKNSNSKYL